MVSNVCVVCRRVFSRMSSLARHINERQTSCHPPTHHCDKCDKGFSSYQTLWEHRRKCLSAHVEIQPTKVISDSDVSSDTLTDQSSSLKVIPYTLASKENGIDSTVLTSPTRIHEHIFWRPQKKDSTLSRVNDSSGSVTLVYSDEEDENKDGGDIKRLFSLLNEDTKRLFTSLDTLSKFIGVGYARLGPAIIDTIDELYKMSVITEGQYQSLVEVFHQFLWLSSCVNSYNIIINIITKTIIIKQCAKI